MKVWTLVIVLCTTVLAGCASSPQPEYTRYTLEYSATDQAPDAGSYISPEILKVLAITAPDWLRTRNMYYQLAYDNSLSLAAYSRARWVSAPPEVVGNLVRGRLSELGVWKAVVGPQTDAHADLKLRVHLSEFHQRFTAPKISDGVLRATATLLDSGSGRVLSQRLFQYNVKASTPDAAGGAAALNRANDQFIDALARWLIEAAPRGEAH